MADVHTAGSGPAPSSESGTSLREEAPHSPLLGGPGDAAPLRVVVYSDDRLVREQVRLALGTRVARDLPPVRVVEVATPRALLQTMDAGGVALAILDGEASPAGGLGMARQLKDEITRCPPVLVLVARQQDAWLATWSRAEAALPYPLDPVRLPVVAAELLRAHPADAHA